MGAVFIGRAPGVSIDYVARSANIGAVTQPADSNQIPEIESLSAEQLASLKKITSAPSDPAVATIASADQSKTVWPIHGSITTLFGVAGPYYHPTHTGIDISDGRPAGSTSIIVYKPGRVIAVIHDSGGLGNHVVVDHGGSMTSVYGHLATIAVKEGDVLSSGTIIGTEGSTGVSTGSHLHFEIRLNGEPVDPQDYIDSTP